MPTDQEIRELHENCTWEWGSFNDVYGCKVVGPNGNSIFLPSAGIYSRLNRYYVDSIYMYYWSLCGDGSYHAFYLYRSLSGSSANCGRNDGFPIRPVYDDSIGEPETQIPEPIDLGLPSGLKWASFNLGATKPEEYGDYYAWGETEPYYSSLEPLTWKPGKEAGYDWPSYKWCMGALRTMTKYCPSSSNGYNGYFDERTILEKEDDVARSVLGGYWRMPTEEEFDELKQYCPSQTFTSVNGVRGRRYTGPNGNSIFLPAAGDMFKEGIGEEGSYGHYWSSSLSHDPNFAYAFFYNTGAESGVGSEWRFDGRSIRPVYDDSEPDDNPWGHPGTGDDGGDNNSSGGDDGLD